jgi:hypothetical protein
MSERLRAQIAQVCLLHPDRLVGTVPSGRYQRRMGGLYRVSPSDASSAWSCIETLMEYYYNRRGLDAVRTRKAMVACSPRFEARRL